MQLALENDQSNLMDLSPKQIKILADTYRCTSDERLDLFDLEYERMHELFIEFAEKSHRQ